MATIEGRATAAWQSYIGGLYDDGAIPLFWHQDDAQAAFEVGYLAGAAQARADYSAHDASKDQT